MLPTGTSRWLSCHSVSPWPPCHHLPHLELQSPANAKLPSIPFSVASHSKQLQSEESSHLPWEHPSHSFFSSPRCHTFQQPPCKIPWHTGPVDSFYQENHQPRIINWHRGDAQISVIRNRSPWSQTQSLDAAERRGVALLCPNPAQPDVSTGSTPRSSRTRSFRVIPGGGTHLSAHRGRRPGQ